MAKVKDAPASPRPETVLPLPNSLLQHHGEVLLPLMKKWKTENRFPPVLLIVGPAGIGKREMAYFIAQSLLCGESVLPCGECRNCQRALNGTMIDFKEIAPEERDDGKSGTLKIEQFRDLKASLGFGAHEGPFKITLFRGADQMTPQAANSLLKILEEPPPGWIFLLTANDPTLLLPTLVSRCQTIRLRPLPPELLVQLLNEAKVPEQRATVAARLANGSWKKAHLIAEDEYWEQRSTLFRFLEKPQAEVIELVDWTAQDGRRLQLVIDLLEELSADLIHWSLSPDAQNYEWANLDGKRALSYHADAAVKRLGSAKVAREFWIDRSEDLAQVRKKISAPLNRKLLAQDLLLPWLGI